MNYPDFVPYPRQDYGYFNGCFDIVRIFFPMKKTRDKKEEREGEGGKKEYSGEERRKRRVDIGGCSSGNVCWKSLMDSSPFGRYFTSCGEGIYMSKKGKDAPRWNVFSRRWPGIKFFQPRSRPLLWKNDSPAEEANETSENVDGPSRWIRRFIYRFFFSWRSDRCEEERSRCIW